MISMDSIRKLSDSYRNIQEAEADVSKIIKDLGDDLAGSNEDQMRGVQLIKGLALSDDPKANEFMQKLDKATSQISKEMSEGYGYTDNPHKKKKKVKEEIETVDEDVKSSNKAYALKKKRHHEYEMKHGKKKDKRGIGESKSLIDLLNNIKNGGKIEDTDLTEEDVNGILDFYENTLDSTGQKEFNKMSITKIQSTMKKLGL